GHPKNGVLVGCGFDQSLAGRNLAEVTADRGREVTPENAAETAIELQLAGGCQAVYHAIDEEDVKRIMQSRLAMVASDGGIPVFGKDVPHPRNYGTFARVLGRYVREQKILPLTEAVRKMTSLPASRLGLTDRGLLRPGLRADIAVFDHTRIIDKAEFLDPHRYSEGVHHVFVNGEAVLLDGKITGALPGEVLYGPARK
ncbi:MAG: amidohydrolase family protein, partial [bacterium]|nr:amidohydrolase family protein [bacterium]